MIYGRRVSITRIAVLFVLVLSSENRNQYRCSRMNAMERRDVFVALRILSPDFGPVKTNIFSNCHNPLYTCPIYYDKTHYEAYLDERS